MESWKLVVGAGVALAGMIVGATLFGSSEARAQRTYRECFMGHQESVDIDASGVVATPSINYMIRVPSGWEVVGAGGTGHLATVLFCR